MNSKREAQRRGVSGGIAMLKAVYNEPITPEHILMSEWIDTRALTVKPWQKYIQDRIIRMELGYATYLRRYREYLEQAEIEIEQRALDAVSYTHLTLPTKA